MLRCNAPDGAIAALEAPMSGRVALPHRPSW